MFTITHRGACFAAVGVQLLLLLHVCLTLPAFPIRECISQCFVPALHVWHLFVVEVVAIPVLSAPAWKIVALPKTNLIWLHNVPYQCCSNVRWDLIWDHNQPYNFTILLRILASYDRALSTTLSRTLSRTWWSHATSLFNTCILVLHRNFIVRNQGRYHVNWRTSHVHNIIITANEIQRHLSHMISVSNRSG